MSEDQALATPTEEIVTQTLTSNPESQEQIIETVDNTDTTDETSDDQQTETVSEEEQERINSAVKKRLLRETRKMALAQQEAEFWKAEAFKQKTAQEQTQTVQQTHYEKKPQLADFYNVEQYSEAIADWKMQQYVEQQEQAKFQAEQKQLADSHIKREQEFAKATPGYYEAIQDVADVPVHSDIMQAIWESDIGPAMTFHFAQNVDELERLNNLPQNKRLLELGKLEAKLSEQKKTVPAVQRVQTKAAPTPVSPVTGKAPVVSKSVYEMSRDELRAHLQAENKAAIARRTATKRR